MYHLHRAPAVKGNLSDIEPRQKPLDKFLDVAVMHHISVRGHEKALSTPKIVGNMVTAHAKLEIVLGNPKVRQDEEFVGFVYRREDKHKGRDVGGGR